MVAALLATASRRHARAHPGRSPSSSSCSTSRSRSGLAALNVFFRDVGNLARHVLRLWFYLSPALYAIDGSPQARREHPVVGQLLLAQPVRRSCSRRTATSSTTARARTGAPLGALLAGRLDLVLLALATIVFKRVEPSFAKVL